MLNEDFVFLVEEFGKPAKAQRLPAGLAARFHGKLPRGLIDLWQEYGLGLWLKGKFQFCLPDSYAPIVAAVLRDDPVFKPHRTHAYGYTAFGELYLWNEDYQNLDINLPRLWGAAMMTQDDWTPGDPDIEIAAHLTGLDRKGAADWHEDSETASPMFEHVRKTRGELALGECYGFVPALLLGGDAKVECVQRLQALEHFAILAQLGPVSLFDYTDMQQRFVRSLGG